MPKNERHYIICGICGGERSYGDLPNAQSNIRNHCTNGHDKVHPYADDAVRTVTIIFETKSPNKEQPPDWTDPTGPFFRAIEMMIEDGSLS